MFFGKKSNCCWLVVGVLNLIGIIFLCDVLIYITYYLLSWCLLNKWQGFATFFATWQIFATKFCHFATYFFYHFFLPLLRFFATSGTGLIKLKVRRFSVNISTHFTKKRSYKTNTKMLKVINTTRHYAQQLNYI